MADIELSPRLIELRRAADAAHAEVRRLQEEYGRPTQEGGWTDEQHAAWQAAWVQWREAATAVGNAMPTKPGPLEVERALKRAAREPVDA
ncbi:hypothetical protein [Streptomyces sp. XY533]|uniref:hypothetical protein n=1 Tax=Streptomyces sp. XY533 TaxID=1519481 RepID=UPI0006ADDF2D|nr:hypothetical protein [Streptomyces sp. XY533]